jgi:hypothetical protein
MSGSARSTVAGRSECAQRRNGGYFDIYVAAGDMAAISEQAKIRPMVPACRITPNPSRGPARIELVLKVPGGVRLGAYDMAGREIAELASRRFEAGTHVITWNGRDESGEEAPSGVYFVRLETSEANTNVKLQYIKN